MLSPRFSVVYLISSWEWYLKLGHDRLSPLPVTVPCSVLRVGCSRGDEKDLERSGRGLTEALS